MSSPMGRETPFHDDKSPLVARHHLGPAVAREGLLEGGDHDVGAAPQPPTTDCHCHRVDVEVLIQLPHRQEVHVGRDQRFGGALGLIHS
jgi:hypothetical protein